VKAKATIVFMPGLSSSAFAKTHSKRGEQDGIVAKDKDITGGYDSDDIEGGTSSAAV